MSNNDARLLLLDRDHAAALLQPDAVRHEGLALQDLSVARMLQRRALATGTGTHIAWPW